MGRIALFVLSVSWNIATRLGVLERILERELLAVNLLLQTLQVRIGIFGLQAYFLRINW